MKAISNLRQRFAKFNNDERGMETLQVVMIVAIAAVILALIVSKWPAIKTWATTAIDGVTKLTN